MIRRLATAVGRVALRGVRWAADQLYQPPAEALDPAHLAKRYQQVTDLSETEPTGDWELSFASDRTAWWIHTGTGDAMVLNLDDGLRSASWKVHHTPDASRRPGHVVTGGSTLLVDADTPETARVFAYDFMKYGRTENGE